MGNSLRRNILSATIAVTLLAACASSGNGGIPNAASSLAMAQNGLGQTAVGVALSGLYEAKFRQKGQSASKAELILSQSQNTLGGAVISKEGSKGFAAAVAWVANGRTISGNAVVPTGSGGFCTISMSGKYKHRRLTGTYSGTLSCSGLAGTFAMWHKCYFQGTGSDAIRPETGVKPC